MKHLVRSLFVVISCLVYLAAVSSVFAASSSPHPGTSSPSSTSGNWPMFGYNAAGSRYNANEKILNTSNVWSLVKYWSYATGGFIDGSPAVVNGTVYVGYGPILYAVNATTGVLLWTYQTVDNIDGSPAVANGIVYVSSRGNGLYAVKAKTG